MAATAARRRGDNEAMDEPEQVLEGGNVAGIVVRAGQTVRKPAGPQTPAVAAFLEHLQVSGYPAAPRSLGCDARRRHVLEYIPGQLADAMPPLGLAGLHRVGLLIRRLHDATAGFREPPDAVWDVAIPPDRRELVCHNDLAPWNLVRDGDRWVFIDWDGAGPGSRLWDLGYAAKGFIPLIPDGDPAADGPRLRALADGYGLDARQRRDLPALMAAHTRGMYDLLRTGAETGRQPWARLHAEGHGAHWRGSAQYIEEHLDHWAQVLLRP
jgi:Ser/Thr protein kinase RdoA (MazF antagonist)